MNKDQWQQIEKIFYAAMELPREDREAFIRQACAGNEELLGELQALLEANRDAASFLDAPVNMPPHSGTFSPTLVMPHSEAKTGAAMESGVHIGAYRLIREIGRGGMGAVWLAERADGQFYQQVAIKLLHAGSENEEVIRRFRHERQILASLDHSNIARLLDGGTTEDGRPYFVMEYIEGLPIDQYCRQHQLSVDDRLRLFRTVCAAVHYAHQNLVIHRDLKPSNIAVTEDGTPKLLDFGIAKLIQPDLSRSYDTLTGVTPMTPAYASPEQVRGEKLTTASDVYSLGVVLYELLTGRSPYRLKAQSFGELMRAVVEQEPERPSTAITRADETPPTNPITFEPTDKLRRRLSGDIDSIVLMALRKEAPLRYSSVEQFSEDLRRYLEGLPTVARRGTLGYRALKYIRRNKVPVAAAALILLSLLGGIGATMRQTMIAKAAQRFAEGEQGRAEIQRMRAENALLTADERRQQAEAARNEADQQRTEAELQKILADEQRGRAEQGEETKRLFLYAAQMKLAQQAWAEGSIERMQELLDAHVPQPGQRDLRGFEWYYLWRLVHSDLVTLKHTDTITSIVLTPDGTKMASQTLNGDIRIWDTATGKELPPIHNREANAYRLAISPDGRFFAQGETNGQVRIYAVSQGMHLATLECSQQVITAITFSPDGRFLAAIAQDGISLVWEALTWKQQATFKTPPRGTNAIVFTPDSKQVLTCGGGGVRVWNPLSGQELKSILQGRFVFTMAFIPGSNHLALGSLDNMVKIWDFAADRQVGEIKTNIQNGALIGSPDGNLIVTTGYDQIVRLWGTGNWALLAEIKCHSGPIQALAFTPDSMGLFTGSQDRALKLRNVLEVLEAKLIYQVIPRINSVTFTHDGRRLISADNYQGIKIHDFIGGKILLTIAAPPQILGTEGGQLLKVAVSPDGRYFATAGYDGIVRTWEEKSNKPLQMLSGHTRQLYTLAISSDGQFIASGGNDLMVKIWDVPSGQERYTLRGHTERVSGAAFSPLGKILVTCSEDKTIKIWDYENGKEMATVKSFSSGTLSLAFSPDGKLLAVGDDKSIVLMDTATWQTIRTLRGHAQRVIALKFSPDGRRLASTSWDATARLWELEYGQEVLTLQGQLVKDVPVMDIAFSPDGTSLATVGGTGAGNYGKLLWWPAATPREVLARSSAGNRPLVQIDYR